MKEHPILFSAPMVRAILAGNKTVTRRVVKPQPNEALCLTHSGFTAWHNEKGRPLKNRYGQPGDRLWVRETWQVARHEPCLPHERDYQELHSPVIRYIADGDARRIQGNKATGVGIYHGPVEMSRPSIHMPRWASRITLEVTGVRVERLQDISEADAIEEGVHRIEIGSGYNDCFSATSATWADVVERQAAAYEDPRFAFRDLWDGINEQRGFGWLANPYVWVIEFKRIPQEQAA